MNFTGRALADLIIKTYDRDSNKGIGQTYALASLCLQRNMTIVVTTRGIGFQLQEQFPGLRWTTPNKLDGVMGRIAFDHSVFEMALHGMIREADELRVEKEDLAYQYQSLTGKAPAPKESLETIVGERISAFEQTIEELREQLSRALERQTDINATLGRLLPAAEVPSG